MKKILKGSIIAAVILVTIILIGKFASKNSTEFYSGVMALVGFGLALLLGAIIIGFIANLARSKPSTGAPSGTAPTAPKSWWEKVMESKIGKSLVTALLLLGLYGLLLWLLYGPIAGTIQSHWLMTDFQAWMIVTILGVAVVIPALWKLFAAANIPGEYKTVKSGFRAVSIAIAIFLAYGEYHQPEAFNTKNRQPNFMVAEKEGKAYYIPPPSGKGEDTARYSPRTGERLRPGKPEDVKTGLVNTAGSGKTIVQTIQNWNRPKIDTVILSGGNFIDAPGIPCTIVYVVPKGEGWFSTYIRTKGMKYWADPQTNVWVSTSKKDGEWGTPFEDGPRKDTSPYYKGATAFGYCRNPNYDILVPIQWWN